MLLDILIDPVFGGGFSVRVQLVTLVNGVGVEGMVIACKVVSVANAEPAGGSAAVGLEIIFAITLGAKSRDQRPAVLTKEVIVLLVAERNLLETAGKGLAVRLEEEIMGLAINFYGFIACGEGLTVLKEIVIIRGIAAGQLLIAVGISPVGCPLAHRSEPGHCFQNRSNTSSRQS